MRRCTPARFAAVALFLTGACPGTHALAATGSVTAAAPKPLSERVVDYQIDARVDARKKTIDAVEILTYRNLTGQPQDTFPFHLYLNAFQPTSTAAREFRRDNEDFEWKGKNFASAEIKSLEVAGMGDLTSQISFIAPDDGNPDDRTVFQVKLPRPVPAGESVQFKIAFHDQLGEVLARTGYKRNFIMGAQWFPKVGVWWQGGWNCHQFHADTEFFADFGTFNVRLTLPQNEVVGASGEEVSSVNHPDGTKTVSFHGEDIHDFAWTAEPEFRVFTDYFTGSAGMVKIRLLTQPGHVAMAERNIRILKETMKRFDQWYGPYPYKQITLVDPPHGGLGASGMEYPTLITGLTLWWMPKGWYLLEETVSHEFGHQYWYGMVATNEFEDAWLDEGINSYTEMKVMDDLYGKDRSDTDLWGMHDGERSYQRLGYIRSADRDPMARFGYQYMDRRSYGDITYNKSVAVLLTLEKIIGETAMRRALRTYFERYRFTHPTKEDFLKTVEEVSGQDLRWYFNQAVYGTQVLDYEILRAASDPADWFVKDAPEEKKGETLYHTTVLVHRKGDFVFPVDVLVKFDNGEQVREHWDGRDRWVRYSYDKRASLVSAEIDPEQAVWLDKDFYNNSYVAAPMSGARRKLSAYWLLFTQFLAQWLAWLV
ncbi:MAG: M1 family metallopeptidase [Acidobacteriia bacterium]|nr:M1 family metallopeptidase [Terriglobia bacterium]